MTHVQEAPSCFANEGKSGDNRGFKSALHQFAEGRFSGVRVLEALLHLAFEFSKAQLQVLIGEGLDFGFLRVDGSDQGLKFFYVALVFGADESRDNSIQYLSCFHVMGSPFPDGAVRIGLNGALHEDVRNILF